MSLLHYLVSGTKSALTGILNLKTAIFQFLCELCETSFQIWKFKYVRLSQQWKCRSSRIYLLVLQDHQVQYLHFQRH